MVFSSLLFLFLFLPVVLLGYFLLPTIKLKNIFLLVASLVFYAWGDFSALGLLLVSIGGNYYLALLIDKSQMPEAKKLWLSLAIVLNLSLLMVFKYMAFFGQSINWILHTLHIHTLRIPQVALPLGISFFTFHALSYIVDVYRGKTKAQSNIGNLALYIALFPQLVAGPIIRYHDIYRQLGQRKTELANFAQGIRRFITGLGKKVLLANVLAIPADQIFALKSQSLTPELAWLGAVCYSLQIYFDFSGYCDMAIGLGLMFGFHFPENFNAPYAAQSIRDFWHRWHISLSTWFRDYLYLPLGGSYGGKLRTAFNLITVFVLCGLWHGASWNFLFWGLYHGTFLALERTQFGNAVSRLWAPLKHFYALLVVMVGWVFFRAENLKQAFNYLRCMFPVKNWTNNYEQFQLYVNSELELVLIVAATISLFSISLNIKHLKFAAGLRLVSLSAIMGLCAMKLASGTYNPFIYFRF